MNVNKDGSVIVKTNLKLAGSDSPVCFSNRIRIVDVRTVSETCETQSLFLVRRSECLSAGAETSLMTEPESNTDESTHTLCDVNIESNFDSCSSIKLPSAIPASDNQSENDTSSIQSSCVVDPSSNAANSMERSSLLRRVVKESKPTTAEVLEPLYKYFKDNKCLLCGFQSKSIDPNFARRHLIIHLSDKKFKCETCGKCFTAPSRLSSHRLVHVTDKEKCICKECGKRFKNMCSLKSHLQKAHSKSQKAHSCFACGKTFASAQILKVHYRVHTGEEPFSCTLCDEKFGTSSALRNHLRRHDDGKRFPCKVCGKEYKKRGLLRQHMNTHQGTKCFKCDMCEKSFNFKSNLAQHMVTHSNARPHSCETCGMKFKLPHHLRSHVEAQH